MNRLPPAAPLPPGWTYVQPLFPEGEPLSLVNLNPTFEDTFEALAMECVDLLVSKQVSYGPKNIEQLGIYGVFSRLASDKIERLRNMMNGRVEKGQIVLDIQETLADESWEDTVKDIVNYGLILLALKRGQWGRPLAANR